MRGGERMEENCICERKRTFSSIHRVDTRIVSFTITGEVHAANSKGVCEEAYGRKLCIGE